mmetsp:Transcript_11329/g.20831  ORF Transcript_11329/g.20831 Transcript_11329/m.20831 type:complete len:390 (-) Transcript_11329:127-1296(-)
MCRTENERRGWAVTLLYPAMLLFTILNFQTSIFSRELEDSGASLSSSVAASHGNMRPLLLNYSELYWGWGEEAGPKEHSRSKLERETRELLSHVLVMITYWYSPDLREIKFLGHTLGTVREWRLMPEIGNVTVVIITNDADATKTAIGSTNDDWYTIHQVESGEHPYYMPFYHREVVADYIDREKEKTNMTVVKKDLASPTSYAYFEADTVLDGAGLIAWAKDTAILHDQGETNHIRHFWRWEWNTIQDCAVFTGQVEPIPRNSSSVISIAGGEFASLDGGKWAGMYVLTAEHMLKFYNSGAFWTHPTKAKKSREEQLYNVVHGNDAKDRNNKKDRKDKSNKKDQDNTIVPIDERTGTVHLVAGVHHQSDKYQKSPWKLGKLCINDLFS